MRNNSTKGKTRQQRPSFPWMASTQSDGSNEKRHRRTTVLEISQTILLTLCSLSLTIMWKDSVDKVRSQILQWILFKNKTKWNKNQTRWSLQDSRGGVVARSAHRSWNINMTRGRSKEWLFIGAYESFIRQKRGSEWCHRLKYVWECEHPLNRLKMRNRKGPFPLKFEARYSLEYFQ